MPDQIAPLAEGFLTVLRLAQPRNWLNLSSVAEISHCETCNSSTILESKYVGDSGRDESGRPQIQLSSG